MAPQTAPGAPSVWSAGARLFRPPCAPNFSVSTETAYLMLVRMTAVMDLGSTALPCSLVSPVSISHLPPRCLQSADLCPISVGDI